MGSSQRLAALALCLILLLDITMPSLVLANKAKGGGRAQKGGGHKGGGGRHKGGKGGGPKGGGVAPNVPKPNPNPVGGGIPNPNPVIPPNPNPVIPPNPIPAAGSAPGVGGVPVPEAGKGIIYHGGPLLTGDINLSILFYGQFTAEQKNVVRSFLRSLENTENDHIAAVHRWWDIVEAYQLFTNKPGLDPTATPPRLRIKVGTQQTDDKYTVGKVLTIDFINSLFKKADSGKPNTLVVLFTGSQVTVTGLCRGKCYEHGLVDNKPYLIVGNPEIECPGACAWPFNRLDYGVPTQVTVKPPNGNAGIDAMLINFASGLAAAVTNPFNTGFFKPGPKDDPIEAGTACDNIFGSGAVPGQTGKLELDTASGGSYNAIGEKGMKFMLPSVWNPRTNNCWTAL